MEETTVKLLTIAGIVTTASIVLTGLVIWSTSSLINKLVDNISTDEGMTIKEGAEYSEDRSGLPPTALRHLEEVRVLSLLNGSSTVTFEDRELSLDTLEIVEQSVFTDGLHDKDPWILVVYNHEELGLLVARYRYREQPIPENYRDHYEEVDEGDTYFAPAVDAVERVGGDPEEKELAESVLQMGEYEEYYDMEEGEDDGENAGT
jgi:hypothetical protein